MRKAIMVTPHKMISYDEPGLRQAWHDHFQPPITDLTVDLIYAWLGTLGTTLWADWDITDPKRRILAAEWLYRQFEQIERYASGQG